jgi:arsenate reductase
MEEHRPHHILFLCAENSARSQMAEAIARTIAPRDTIISSAGSNPTQVRPEAAEVMKELGIDISHQRAKDVSAIHADSVDLVVTLCADQVCPILPSDAQHLHWELPDPVKVEDRPARQAAFRQVRDELRRRLDTLFYRFL